MEGRQEVDSIDLVDNVRYHITANSIDGRFTHSPGPHSISIPKLQRPTTDSRSSTSSWSSLASTLEISHKDCMPNCLETVNRRTVCLLLPSQLQVPYSGSFRREISRSDHLRDYRLDYNYL